MMIGRPHRLLATALLALASQGALAQAPQTQSPSVARAGAMQGVEDRTSGMR
jgi:hypothetical protein